MKTQDLLSCLAGSLLGERSRKRKKDVLRKKKQTEFGSAVKTDGTLASRPTDRREGARSDREELRREDKKKRRTKDLDNTRERERVWVSEELAERHITEAWTGAQVSNTLPPSPSRFLLSLLLFRLRLLFFLPAI